MALKDLDTGCVRMLCLLMHPLLVAARELDGTVRALVRLSSEMGVDVAVEVGFAGECLATALDWTDLHAG
jgi:methylglyoxal synthase